MKWFSIVRWDDEHKHENKVYIQANDVFHALSLSFIIFNVNLKPISTIYHDKAGNEAEILVQNGWHYIVKKEEPNIPHGSIGFD